MYFHGRLKEESNRTVLDFHRLLILDEFFAGNWRKTRNRQRQTGDSRLHSSAQTRHSSILIASCCRPDCGPTTDASEAFAACWPTPGSGGAKWFFSPSFFSCEASSSMRAVSALPNVLPSCHVVCSERRKDTLTAALVSASTWLQRHGTARAVRARQLSSLVHLLLYFFSFFCHWLRLLLCSTREKL